MEDAQATAPATEEQTPAGAGAPTGSPGFGERGRMRRRARFLRKARELAYRDLGGLVFNLHRFGQRNDVLVMAKLSTLGDIDAELRALEAALAEHQPVTVLRDAGIAACPRCAAIHGSEDRFCPNCGLAMDRHAERPVAGPPPSGAAIGPPPATTAAPAPAVTASAQAIAASAQAVAASATAPAAASPATAPTPAPPTPSATSATGPATSPPSPTPAHSPITTPGRIPRPAATPPAAPPDSGPAPAATRSAAPPVGPGPGAPTAPSPTDTPASDADQPTVIVRPPRPDA